MHISKNFTHREAIRSKTAQKHGIDNEPSKGVLIEIVHTSISMQAVRSALGDRSVRPSSWYRSIELNRKLGSSDNSDHIEGKAVDFTVEGLTNREAFNIIRNSGIEYKQLILEFEDRDNGGWLHISFPMIGKHSARQNLIATAVNGETIYTEVK